MTAEEARAATEIARKERIARAIWYVEQKINCAIELGSTVETYHGDRDILDALVVYFQNLDYQVKVDGCKIRISWALPAPEPEPKPSLWKRLFR